MAHSAWRGFSFGVWMIPLAFVKRVDKSLHADFLELSSVVQE